MKLVVPMLLLSACVSNEMTTHGELTQALESDNGENLNGQNLNGENLNGENLNGENLNGENLNGPSAGAFSIYTSLTGVTLGGSPLDSAKLTATVFHGTRGDQSYSGSDFVGAEFHAMRGDGQTVKMRIAQIEVTSSKSSYFVDYLGTDGNWYPICTDDEGRNAAYPLEGTWDHRQGVEGGGSHTDDPTRFTFACRKTGALGKCVDIGYEPWAVHGVVALAAHHQACVRMLRADYCGNGQPYTTDGRRINVYDALGIQHDTNAWRLDAEWTAAGARCLTSYNRSSAPVPCFDAAKEASCGLLEHFQNGTLIMDELP